MRVIVNGATGQLEGFKVAERLSRGFFGSRSETKCSIGSLQCCAKVSIDFLLSRGMTFALKAEMWLRDCLGDSLRAGSVGAGDCWDHCNVETKNP